MGINPLEKLKERINSEKEYFATFKSNIAAQNLLMEKEILHFLIVVYVILLGVAVLVLTYFKIHWVYYLMFPIIAIFFTLNIITHKKEKAGELSAKRISLRCYAFYYAVFTEIIFIDTLHDPSSSAAWYPVLLAVFPTFLIAPYKVFVITDAILGTLLIVISYFMKPPWVWHKDLFAVISGTIMSLMTAYIILTIRIKDYERQMQLVKMSEEADRAKAMAEKANRSKSDFLSQMSHEIRTPINAILGMDEMIIRDTNDPKLKEYAHNIRNAGNTLLALINDILDISKIEAGKMELVEGNYDLSLLINDLYSMIYPRARKKGLTITFDVDPKTPRYLYGDVVRLKQCILNLLTNGVKYTDRGVVTLTISYARFSGAEIMLTVSVKDTGIGIKREDMERLLKPFERVDVERNRNVEGTGLGVSIVEQFLSLMDSKLNIHSVYGAGSTFSFIVKQGVTDWDRIGDYKTYYKEVVDDDDAIPEGFFAPKAKVLIVDDTEMNLAVAKGLLKNTGMKIDTASGGMEGLMMMTRHKYDLVFIDHRMPGIDGMEMLKRIRNEYGEEIAKTKCVALTANAIGDAKQTYLDAGFDDYLSKPINSERLMECCIKHLPKEYVTLGSEKKDEEAKNTNYEALNESSLLDREEGVKNCGSDELYKEALKIFYDTYEFKSNEIKELFDEENITDYTTKVHALKSSARIIGAKELSEKALRLENAGDENDVELIKAETGTLLEMYKNVAEEISGVIGLKKKVEDKPYVDEKVVLDAIGAMKDFASQMDLDLMQMVLESLEDERLKPEDEEIFNDVKKLLQNLDWDGIIKVLEGRK